MVCIFYFILVSFVNPFDKWNRSCFRVCYVNWEQSAAWKFFSNRIFGFSSFKWNKRHVRSLTEMVNKLVLIEFINMWGILLDFNCCFNSIIWFCNQISECCSLQSFRSNLQYSILKQEAYCIFNLIFQALFSKEAHWLICCHLISIKCFLEEILQVFRSSCKCGSYLSNDLLENCILVFY